MHTSVFKLVWASLACIQVKFLYLHHKGRVLIILACILGLIDFIRALSYFCDFLSIVSPILLSYLNFEVKCMICKFICEFTMLWNASLSCYASFLWCNMQVYHVMQVFYDVICKFIMLCYASLICKLSYDMQVMLCKFGMLIWFMLSCYASLSWVYEHKASSFMPKVAFWQHVSYHISYDNLHVRLNANLWPFLHVI